MRHPLLTAALMGAGLLTTGAQAQSYTYKELVRPTGTVYCELQLAESVGNTHPMNARGDVVGVCKQLGGYNFGQSSLLGYNPFFPVPWYSDKPVLWAAGSGPKLLPVQARQTASHMGVLDAGEAVARLTTYDGKAMPYDPAAFTDTRWTAGGVSQTWQPCGAQTAVRRSVSRNGHTVCWVPAQTTLVLSAPGRPPIPLPALPAEAGAKADAPTTVMINDLGQVLVGTRWDQDQPAAWLWDGQQWQAIRPPQGVLISSVSGLNNSGTVLMRTSDRAWHLWRAGQFRTLTLDTFMPKGLDDQERLFGYDASVTNYLAPHVGIWVNGKFTLLDTATANWPSAWQISRVADSLADGRLLVEVYVNQKSVTGRHRLVMLTPK